MAQSEMVDVLEKLGLNQFIEKFLEEKITPEIFCNELYEFRLLVIADSSDIMSLHVYCCKYGRYTPQKLPSLSGALKLTYQSVFLKIY